jgi:hypothetical protein
MTKPYRRSKKRGPGPLLDLAEPATVLWTDAS